MECRILEIHVKRILKFNMLRYLFQKNLLSARCLLALRLSLESVAITSRPMASTPVAARMKKENYHQVRMYTKNAEKGEET